MKADLSRETFDAAARHTAVRLQQGRVLTDADFNEQGDITRWRIETLGQDLIGGSGAPAEGAGFALSAGMVALAVHAQDANSVWIAGEDGVLLVSSNAGASWTLADTGSTRHLRAIARAANTGWAVGDGGSILRSNDAGASWTAQDGGVLSTLRGVAVLNAQRAWAVGDGGLVLRTVNGGAAWTRHAAGVPRLYAVAFSSEQEGLAVGQGGAIVRSSDGGATWARVDSGSQATLRALVLDGANAWAAGDGGTLLRSSDGGNSWTALSSGSAARLRALRFRNASTGWAAGDGGTLLATSNGGNSWTATPAPDAAAFTGLSVAGNAEPWLVGGGQVRRVLATGAGAPTPLPGVSLRIGAGRYYVQGQLCEWRQDGSLANQPDGGVPQRLPPGTHLLYLRAWQRHLSALEAPQLREVALGGPDTATRLQQVAQVRALALPQSAPDSGWHCGAELEAWNQLTAAPSARLAARAEPELATTGVCEIAATAGYRRLENQLYRVEIHAVDADGQAWFKWSRENGSVAYAVESVSIDTATQRTTVRVAARGRDEHLDLALHDRVELVDDEAELQQRAGVLLEYVQDGDDARELVLAGVPPAALGRDPGRHPLLRRWDHRPAAPNDHGALPVTEGVWTTLEDGVQVRFAPGGSYRPGDYWQVPARTASADVEWPRDDEGAPLDRPPAGVVDGWARLGMVSIDGNGLVSAITDCRDLFPPLNRMTQLLYVGGDGQHTTPGGALAEPLRVRVARGALPLAGARVRFGVEAGGGSLGLQAPWGATSGASVDALCDAQGLAECRWQLGSAAGQRVRAQLLSSGGQAIAEQQLVFAAQAQAPSQGGGARGCELTIGEGGDFPALDSELLLKLIEQSGGRLCLCFLPGEHKLPGLRLDLSNRREPVRLALHGCGPTAVVRSEGPIVLAGLQALGIADLEVHVTGRAATLALQNINALQLDRLRMPAKTDGAVPPMQIQAVGSVHMHGCEIGPAPLASAVLSDLGGLADIRACRFGGALGFFGLPGPDERLEELEKVLGVGNFGVEHGGGRLVLRDNQLTRVTVGSDLLAKWRERGVSGLFDTAVLAGNSFAEAGNVLGARQLSAVGNHFQAERRATGGSMLYGVMVCRMAAASGNVAEVFNEAAVLSFVQPRGEVFRGAANAVFTRPGSLG